MAFRRCHWVLKSRVDSWSLNTEACLDPHFERECSKPSLRFECSLGQHAFSLLLALLMLPACGAGNSGTAPTATGGAAAGGGTASSGGSAAGGSGAGGAGAGGGEVWRPFSDDSPWNTPIPEDAAIHGESRGLISHLINSSEFEGLGVSITPWSVPVYWVDGSIPRVAVRTPLSNEGENLTLYWPVPADAKPAPEADAHMTLIDSEAGYAYDFWASAKREDGSWDCGLCASIDLNGTGVRPPSGSSAAWWESHGSRACGFPLIAGLIRAEEIKAGRIDHALTIAYPGVRQGSFTPPASTGHPQNGIISPDQGIPCGGRLQLDPAIDVSSLGLSPDAEIIARALQEYGAYVGDFSESINLYADGSDKAQAAFQGVLSSGQNLGIDLEQLRVIQWGPLH